mgnify:CR=1 FL=1
MKRLAIILSGLILIALGVFLARDAAKLGQRLDVVVLAVDGNTRRISLGLAEPGDDNDAPASKPSVPEKLGTFADLLKKKK